MPECEYCGEMLSEHEATDDLRDFVMEASWDSLELEPTEARTRDGVIEVPGVLRFTQGEYDDWLRGNNRPLRRV